VGDGVLERTGLVSAGPLRFEAASAAAPHVAASVLGPHVSPVAVELARVGHLKSLHRLPCTGSEKGAEETDEN